MRGRVGLKDSPITSVWTVEETLGEGRTRTAGREWDSAIIMEMDLDGQHGLAHVYMIHPCLDKI